MNSTERTARILELETELSKLRSEEHAEQCSKSPFKIGDVIQWKGRLGKVVTIIPPSYGDRFGYRVIRILKDGSAGQQCRVYHWDNPTAAING